MRLRTPNTLIKIAFIVLIGAAVETGWLGLLVPLENRLSDTLIRLHAKGLSADPDIVIVDIDEKSLAVIGETQGRYPWPRSVHATLLEGILKQKPRAVVFDIVFSDNDYTAAGDSDAYFNEVIHSSRNIFFPILRASVASARNDRDSEAVLGKFGPSWGFIPTESANQHASVALILPFGAEHGNWRFGTIDYNKDEDDIGRRYDLFTPAYGWLIPSLPARVAMDLGYNVPQQKDFLIYWRGGQFAHPRIPYYELYQDVQKRTPARNPHELTNKIVIIGATAPILGDLRATPVASLYPGVEILATAIDDLKNQQFLQAPPSGIKFLLTALLITLLVGAFRRTQNAAIIFLLFFPFTPLLIGVSYYAVTARVLLPVLSPLVFGWLFYAAASLNEYITERRSRQRTIDQFSRFLDPQVVQQVIGDDSESIKTHNTEISVLFSDIRSFTTLSEGRSPQLIFALLNRYFSSQVNVIFQHGGTMDKFIGDAIMAFWGAPLPDPEHARHAVEAALDMSDEIPRFRETLARIAELAAKQEKDKLGELAEITSLDELAGLKDIAPNFEIGIGIHSGPATVGMLGFEGRMDYTCIGDAVNTASRTEGQTKGKARILVTAETRERCGEEFDFIDHGVYKVKGREQEVHLYEPVRKQTA